MNRYEILIGKKLPPEPPKPPEPPRIREILIGKRRSGETFELVNYIRKAVDKGITPLVCVSHPRDYIIQMLGNYARRVHLIPEEDFRREEYYSRTEDIYYDDITLFRYCEKGNSIEIKDLSFDRRFVEKQEIIVTCDTAEMQKYCQISGIDSMPMRLRIGFDVWEVVPIPRPRPRYSYDIYRTEILGNFV